MKYLAVLTICLGLCSSALFAEVKQINESAFTEEVLNYQGLVVVDFYADWCGPCKAMLPILTKVSGMFGNVRFVKVNIDQAKNLSKQYNIGSIPTFVWIKNGKEASRKVGGVTEASFVAETERLL